jgi:hypothetical protein
VVSWIMFSVRPTRPHPDDNNLKDDLIDNDDRRR